MTVTEMRAVTAVTPYRTIPQTGICLTPLVCHPVDGALASEKHLSGSTHILYASTNNKTSGSHRVLNVFRRVLLNRGDSARQKM